MNLKPFFVLIALALLVSACSPTAAPAPAQIPQELLTGQQNPAAAELQAGVPVAKEAGVPAVPAPGEYPTSPEGVVQAFLASYEAQPDQMVSYLSQGQASGLPAGGANALLDFNGTLEGFVIDAASVNPEPPVAIVSAAVMVGGEETRRNFTLGKEDGQWKIESVETPAG